MDPGALASSNPRLRVRRFNRFYTRQVGALSRWFLESP
jgi:hypothetical protein